MQHSSNEAVLLSLVNEEVIEQWCNEQRTGRKGASNYYSDMAMPDGNPKRERYNGHNRNLKALPHPRDENIRSIRQVGRKLLVARKWLSSAFFISNSYVSAQNHFWRQVTATLFRQSSYRVIPAMCSP